MTNEEAIEVFTKCIELNDKMTFCINDNSPLYNACMVALAALIFKETIRDAIKKELIKPNSNNVSGTNSYERFYNKGIYKALQVIDETLTSITKGGNIECQTKKRGKS